MNFKLIRGDDQVFTLIFKEGGGVKDITGWTIFFTLKKNQDDSDDDAVIQKDITSHTDPTQGETEFSLANAETDPLQGIYYYDVQYKDTSTPENIKTVMIGTMSFEKDVTRRIE